MDTGHWYVARNRQQLSLYLPPGLRPPRTLELENIDLGEPVKFHLLRDTSLDCEATVALAPGKKGDDGKLVTTGKCRSYDCHRRELGKCQCGRHPGTVRFEVEQ